MTSIAIDEKNDIREQLSNRLVQVAAFSAAAITWLLFIQSANTQKDLKWYSLLFGGRVFLLILAVLMGIARARWSFPNAFSIYCIVCMALQSLFSGFEPPSKIEFYQYVSYFYLLSSLSYEGSLSNWAKRFLPAILACSLVPLFFKEGSLFASIGVFAFTFTTPIALSIVASLIIIIVTDKYSALRRNVALQNSLRISGEEKKQQIENELQRVRARLVQETRMAAIGQVASQVVHDIRSPLAALHAVKDDLDAVPSASKRTVETSIDRIQNICRVLFERFEASQALVPREGHSIPVLSIRIEDLAKQIVEEKRLLHRTSVLISHSDLGASISELFSPIDKVELGRVLSNILDNSIEATLASDKKEKVVDIAIASSASEIQITIKDNGIGIPKDRLGKLFERGATFGKRGGSGLGLYHAKLVVDQAGGRVAISSEEGAGTIVKIQLPVSKTAQKGQATDLVLVDNDELVRESWIAAAKAKKLQLRTFSSSAALLEEIESLPKDTPVYLDIELGEAKSGEDLAKQLYALGFTKIFFATGRIRTEVKTGPWISGVVGKVPPWL